MDLRTEARNVEMTPRWREQIERGLAKLSKQHRIIHARVTLNKNPHHKKKDDVAEVVMVLGVPGATITARKASKTFEEALDAAFLAAGRELGERLDSLRQTEIRTGAPPFLGTIDRIFADEGYGFIILEDGRPVYFHRNAVHGLTFDQLTEGMIMRLNVEEGDKGLHATTVNPPVPTDKRAPALGAFPGQAAPG